VLSGDPTTNAAAVVGASEADKKLEALTDDQLLAKAVRQSLITLIVLLEEIRRQGSRLMATWLDGMVEILVLVEFTTGKPLEGRARHS
jgi:hypothetical protein